MCHKTDVRPPINKRTAGERIRRNLLQETRLQVRQRFGQRTLFQSVRVQRQFDGEHSQQRPPLIVSMAHSPRVTPRVQPVSAA